MRVIVAGCRELDDYLLVSQTLDRLFSNKVPDEIVCGMARGADSLGRRYALERNIPIKEFPADWNGLGRKAGPLRNQQMAEYATHLVAFWDGTSTGTRDMISRATKLHLQLRIKLIGKYHHD